MKSNGFTPTEKRIMDLLSDGERHARAEVHSLINDELSDLNNMRLHILNLRKKLPEGEAVLCEISGYKTFYRHVKLIKSK